MPTVMLTARFVESVKPGGTQVDYWDERVTGLGLRVSPAGTKSWVLLYRMGPTLRRWTMARVADRRVPKAEPTPHAKERAYLTLAEARDRAQTALRDVPSGRDPALGKKQRREAETFKDLADAYLTDYAKKRKRSWKADDRILRAEVLPHWKYRAVADIRRRDVLDLVNAIAARGAPTLANRTTALLSKAFKFAVDTERLETSPAVRIPRPAPEQQRDRVLTADELRQLWTEFGALPLPMAAFYQLRLLTAQRGGEVASMKWTDLDLTAGWWTIPAGQSKNKLPHRVPLTASAIAILEALRTAADDHLEARRKRDPDTKAPTYVLENARGKRQRSEAAATFSVSDFRGHDLRRTAASFMASGGIPRLVISKVLNHVERDITAVYDRHSYDAEKRVALEAWDRALKLVLEQKDSGNVLSFSVKAS